MLTLKPINSDLKDDPALLAFSRLFAKHANSDTHDSLFVKEFLLSVYDSARFPFDLRLLASFDSDDFSDSLNVLQVFRQPNARLLERHFSSFTLTFEALVIAMGVNE